MSDKFKNLYNEKYFIENLKKFYNQDYNNEKK